MQNAITEHPATGVGPARYRRLWWACVIAMLLATVAAVLRIVGDLTAGGWAGSILDYALPSPFNRLLLLYVIFLPYRVVLYGLKKNKVMGAGLLATGLGLLGLIVFVPYALVSFALGPGLWVYPYLLVALGVQCVLVYDGIGLLRGQSWTLPRPVTVLKGTMVIAVLLAGTILSLFDTMGALFSPFGSPGFHRAMAASEIVGELHQAISCVASYAALHPAQGFPAGISGGKPGTVDILGCHYLLDADNEEGYLYEYTPGSKDTEGRITKFSLSARPLKYSECETLNYFTDDTAVIHYTREDRRATADDTRLEISPSDFNAEQELSFPLDPVPVAEQGLALALMINTMRAQRLSEKILSCANDYAAAHPLKGYPGSLAALGPEGSGCLDNRAAGAWAGYVFVYSPGKTNHEGKREKFTVTARPWRYGWTGTGSFRFDNSGISYSTEEDRPATKDDPPI